jgi:hypothetical protein
MSNPSPDARAHALARALLAAPDPAACDACLDALEGYVDAQLAGEGYQALLPTVAAHLDSCVECAVSYAVLYEVRLAEARGALPSVAAPPPDLSFLPQRQGLAELLVGALRRAGDTLRLALSEPLLDALRDAPRPPALALRDADDEPLFALDLATPDPLVERLTLAAYAESSPGSCQVQVSVALPGRSWPQLAGLPVRLVSRNLERSALTDPWGEASFERIPLTALPGLSVELALAASTG